MKQNVSPVWIVIAVIVVAGAAYLFYNKNSAASNYSATSDVKELEKTKAPGNPPPLQPGGVVPGSGMSAPSALHGK